MISYIKLIRIPNLLIVAALQFLLYFGILIPVYEKNGLSPVLNSTYFSLLVIATMLVTAAAYVINDFLDIEIDRINKPEKLIISRLMSKNEALKFYLILAVTGLIISLSIAIYINKIYYIIIYILAFLFLYYYSYSLKRQPLVGNIIVSAFSSFVLAIVLFFEYTRLQRLKISNPYDYEKILYVFIGFMVFSFLISFYREIIKDIEDVKGDKYVNAKTLPILYGVEISKAVCGVISILLLISLFLWLKMDFNSGNIYLFIYIFFLLILPLFYSVYLLKNASGKKDFHKLSLLAKIIMISGILLLLFYI